ncbi:hypothetical protein A3L09_05525 [Thermococcus profundus]|uniref:Uncharacterized protein n=1 Tax=Thermococcus profundus TaxID=49899 RepID=A0A2Z2MBA6_THEPR|nr:hypothetical protein [Thermococcus profundus]ASJ02749.1 hypothetical protein A3L09_05525 [Thermococcus profundus]
MKRKLFAAFILFLLFIGYLAYLNSLPPAVRAYKMARIAENEQLIAVYHDTSFWQFATYNPETRKLKVYAIYSENPILPWGNDVKSVETPLNYSPLALDLKLLEKAPEETPALLFNGKWYTRENPLKFPRAEDVNREFWDKPLRSLTACWAGRELWVGGIRLVGGDAVHGSVGSGKVLAIPSLEENPGKKFVWYAEVAVNNEISTYEALYPGNIRITGRGKATDLRPFRFTDKTVSTGLGALKYLEGTQTAFISLMYYANPDGSGAHAGFIALTRYWKGISMKEQLPPAYSTMEGTDIPANITE